MIEILFRGKTESSKRWVVGDLLQWSDGEMCICENRNHFEKDKYRVIPETVGQYTGLTDKNGKKIFEGDILKFGDFVYSVEWKEDRLGYGYAERADRMLEQDGGHCTIIGNVHDNPDFLKGE